MSDQLYFQSENENSFSKLQNWAYKNRWAVAVGMIGLVFLIFGGFTLASNLFQGEKVEVLPFENSQGKGVLGAETQTITVEIAGQVEKPGVFELKSTDRVEQLLVASGGLASSADRDWIDKNLNRAAKLVDGQKVYIPKVGESSTSIKGSTGITGTNTNGAQNSLVNINTASLKDLDTLPGIGATRAQAIIDHRPYSTIDELVSKKAITKSIFDKIKSQITL